MTLELAKIVAMVLALDNIFLLGLVQKRVGTLLGLVK
jgi:hypothetical protein